MALKNRDVTLIPKLAHFNFVFLGIFALFIIIFDGGNVLTREGIYRRWMFAALLAVVYTLFWIAARKASTTSQLFRALLLCVAADLALAGFMTYSERGMASTSTILYLLPIASMAVWRSRTYTLAAALFSAAAYIFATTKYFYDFFNEGYRVQLYGEMFFYCATFILAGYLLGNLARLPKK
jgi:hypothetical protein